MTIPPLWRDPESVDVSEASGSLSAPGATSIPPALPVLSLTTPALGSARRRRAASGFPLAGLLTPAVQLSSQFSRDWLEVHEVAEAPPCTLAHLVLATASLPEVGDGREFGVDRATVEPAVVQVGDRLLRVLFIPELNVYVANKMVAHVVTNVHLLNLSILVFQLCEDLFEEVIKVLLRLHIRHCYVRAICCLCCVLRVDVQVAKQDRLTEGWVVV